MSKEQQISVLGCGWLGLELSKTLIEDGFLVKGSTTSEDKIALLNTKGLNPYLIKLTEEEVIGDIENFLKGSNVLVINVPPGLRRNKEKNHVKEIETLLSKIKQSGLKKIVFVSSTTVFEDTEDFSEITNETEPNGTSNASTQLIAVEQLLYLNTQLTTQIIRPGGLVGEGRHPGRILSGRTNIKNPKAPINLIHRKDLIRCIVQLIKNIEYDVKVNAVYPIHPSKKDYYTNYCLEHKLPLPSFEENTVSKGKRIKSEKTEQLLRIKFQHRP